MDLLTKKLAEALRAVLPFVSTVADDPFNIDSRAAAAAVAEANQALQAVARANGGECSSSTPVAPPDGEVADGDQLRRRERVNVLVRLICEMPLTTAQILLAANLAGAIESGAPVGADDIEVLDRLLREARLSEEHACQLRSLRETLLSDGLAGSASHVAPGASAGEYPPPIEAAEGHEDSGAPPVSGFPAAGSESDQPPYDPTDMRGMRLRDLERLPHSLRAKAFFDLDRYYMLEHHRHRLRTLERIQKPDGEARRLIEQSRAAIDGTNWCIGRFDLYDESYMDLLDAANQAS